jgi:N-methylhydantoinase A
LFVDLVHDRSQSFVMGQNEDRYDEAEAIFVGFEADLAKRLRAEGAKPADATVSRFVDVRYVGQLHTITVSLPHGIVSAHTISQCVDAFHDGHLREYRYCRREWPVEISVLRAEGRAPIARPNLTGPVADAKESMDRRDVYFDREGWVSTMIVDRNTIGPGRKLSGPVIVEEYDSTVLIPSGAHAEVDRLGNLLISTGARQ